MKKEVYWFVGSFSNANAGLNGTASNYLQIHFLVHCGTSCLSITWVAWHQWIPDVTTS